MINRTWVRDTYTVTAVEFDGDLHEFEVTRGDNIIATITPADLDNQAQIVEDLDAGECVDGWEDGKGNVINID